MVLISLVNQIKDSNLCKDLLKRSSRENKLILKGTSRVANSLIVSALAHSENNPLIIIVPTFEDAGAWYSLLNLMGWEKIYVYPTSESSPYDNSPLSTEIKWGQIQVLTELVKTKDHNKICIIATERSLQPHLPPSNELKKVCITLQPGQDYDLEELSIRLSKIGYTRVNTVEQEGSWSRRGDILDIYPVNSEIPVRLEFFGNNLEKIKEFDTTSQRSQCNVSQIYIAPVDLNYLIAEELLKSDSNILQNFVDEDFKNDLVNGNITESTKRFLGFLWKDPSSLIDYLPLNSFLIIDDKQQCVAHANNWLENANYSYQQFQESINLEHRNFALMHKPINEILVEIQEFNGLEITSLAMKLNEKNYHEVSNRTLEITPNQFGKLSQSIKAHLNSKNSVYLLSAQPSRAVALLEEHECPAKFVQNPNDFNSIKNLISNNTPIALKSSKEAPIEGVYLPTFKIVLFTDKEFFGQQSLVNNAYIRRRKKSSSSTIDPYKLHAGDYVVHRTHGIGKFNRIDKITINSQTRDYLVVKYLDGILRVAADQLNSLSRFRSSNNKPPKINKMGGQSWNKIKDKAKKSIKKVALDLIKLYAERENKTGYSFPPDGPWQNELEDSFPYQATNDQIKAVNDVKKDMENEKPMDRLICGDVGFGKTEVAIRAMFKAITSGKQIALLAPTTILAQQHWRTISDRFAPYPIKVSLLNRFRTSTERRTILEELKAGKIDAIVGTHQLLNNKTEFNKLGLLVIDEEQRFGVNQKEKIKSLKKSVDVLTLSATPIPRTLYMSLSGVREMSLIQTPPPLRRSIKTHLSQMDNEVIRTAISQEIDRGGQIFYVVPRVEGIEDVALKLKNMIPNMKLIIAHGQMTEGQLENSMIAFNAGEADLMLCTTIIESGLDIPRVNTILIEDSHRFGLSQLYQLRGRVGRSGVQAYAWLFYPNNLRLSTTARDRLKAIQEFTSLGSGYQLSMRDMEIRGVGNILGVEQSGQMEVIGFDLYMELLQEAMADIQGQNIPEVEESQVDLSITAFIPGDYIVDTDEKISAYRSASQCKSQQDLLELASNWSDRYGALPIAVETLLQIMNLKLKAKTCGFSRITNEKPNIALETKMDEPAFRFLRQGLPSHLQGRLIYIKGNLYSKVIARGLGVLSNEKQIEELIKWFGLMEKQVFKKEVINS